MVKRAGTLRTGTQIEHRLVCKCNEIGSEKKKNKCQKQSYSGLSLLDVLEIGKARRHMLIAQRESHAKARMRHCYQMVLTA